MVPRTASAVAIIVLLLFFAASAFAEGGRTGKDAADLAKEVEGKIVKRANESVRVQSVGCQFSIEFATHRVTFQVPLRGSRIMASDDDAGIVLMSSSMIRKFRDREAEPYERLFLRFDRATVDQMVSEFQQAIRACET